MWTTILLIIFCTIVIPIWLVLHYLSKWRTASVLSKNEAEILETLWTKASRIEQRVEVLETILDAKSNNWRNTQ